MVSGHAWQQRPALVWGSLVRQTAVEDNMVQTTERCTNRRAAMRALMLDYKIKGIYLT
jgi:hypothetical protein